jgi:hypothetical protein
VSISTLARCPSGVVSWSCRAPLALRGASLAGGFRRERIVEQAPGPGIAEHERSALFFGQRISASCV